jgi:hypothetical protein
VLTLSSRAQTGTPGANLNLAQVSLTVAKIASPQKPNEQFIGT